jgi:hypothetical protein
MMYPGKELTCEGSKGMWQVVQENVRAVTGIRQGSNNDKSREG